MKKVSVIISNRNDVAMLAVTVRSSLEELKPFGEGGEVVICDNSDADSYELVKGAIPSGYMREGKIKIVRQDFPCLFTARDTAIRNAEGRYSICLDSHMIVGRNMILDLVRFMDRHRDDPTVGFAHAPISWAHQHEDRARHDRDMSKHELGDWHNAYKEERTITWKGMPWICRSKWFLDKDKGLGGYGALSQFRVSWGGGDMHIGIKPWLLGFKNWAVPTSPGIHIGPFPKVDRVGNDPGSVTTSVKVRDRYRLYRESGHGPHTIGFLVSCYVLGGEAMMKRNLPILKNRFGKYANFDKWWQRAMDWGKDEREWLERKQKLTFEQLLELKPWDQS